MDLLDSLRVLLRQWRVVAIGAAVVILLGGAALFVVPTKYQASGQLVLLLPPQATGSSTPTNPYLNLEPGLTTTASIIAATVSTNDAARTLEAAGFTSDYAVALNPQSGPVLLVSADDTDPVMAVRTRDEVIRRLNEQLSQIQADVSAPSGQLIQSRASANPGTAEALPGSKIRALAGIGGVGVLLTLVVAFLRDRRTRPEQASAPLTSTEDDEVQEAAPIASAVATEGPEHRTIAPPDEHTPNDTAVSARSVVAPLQPTQGVDARILELSRGASKNGHAPGHAKHKQKQQTAEADQPGWWDA